MSCLKFFFMYKDTRTKLMEQRSVESDLPAASVCDTSAVVLCFALEKPKNNELILIVPKNVPE